MLHTDCRGVAAHICIKNAITSVCLKFCAMAKPNINQTQEQTSVADNAATLRSERQASMANANAAYAAALRRVSQTDTQHTSPSPTPSKNINASASPELSQAVREQWNVPQEETSKPKASLQDVKNIGQSLKSQGVTTSEVSQGNSRGQIENSFDRSEGTGSTSTQGKPLSETDKVTAQAKQSVQKESESQPLGWER